MVEVILNNNSTEQFVSVVELSQFPKYDIGNNGKINMGAGNTYLFMAYSTFDTLYGFIMCGFDEQFNTLNKNYCVSNPNRN